MMGPPPAKKEGVPPRALTPPKTVPARFAAAKQTGPKMGSEAMSFASAKQTGPKMGSEAMSFEKQTGPKMGSEAMRPPPVPPRRWAEAAKELKAEMHAAAVVHGAEMHAAAVARGEAEPAAGPPKRGARPDRPSQKAREAGRSWERMAEKLSDVKVELAMKSAEVVELQGRMAEMEMEQGQKVKLLTEQISQLEAANFQVTTAHNQLLASLPNLGQSGQHKQLYEQAEASRAELQRRLEKNTADNLQQLQVMLEEKQAAAEERRAQLVKEHVRQLRDKEAEFKEQSREVTALREELLQKDTQIKSLQTQAQREKARVGKKRLRGGNLKNSLWEVSKAKASEPKKKQEPKQPKVPRIIIIIINNDSVRLGRLQGRWCPPRTRFRSKRHRLLILLYKVHNIHILSLPEIERPSPRM